MIEHSAAAKAVVDDELFTRLLEAAYIIQERQGAQEQPVSTNLSQIVAQVVEIQRIIHSQNLGLQPALELIGSRLREFTGAAGMAIGRIDDDLLKYLAANGSAAVLSGSSISVHASSSSRCLAEGACVRSYRTQSESRADLQLCRKLAAESFLAVPVFHGSAVAGAVELFFARPNAFDEVHVRTAELMAGIASEVLAQNAERELKQELASERASVLMALETLKPQLQRLAGENDRAPADKSAKAECELCRACGHAFVDQEASCGICGASRATGKYPGSELQSKWAALWERQLIDAEQGPSFRRTRSADDLAEDAGEDVPVASDFDATVLHTAPTTIEADTDEIRAGDEGPQSDTTDDPEETTAVAGISDHPEWQSAQRAKEWLAAQVPKRSPTQQWKRMLAARAGDISLIMAAIVFAAVVIWGLFWPSAPPQGESIGPATAVVRRKYRPRPPQLSLFEKLLVATGLAVPPPAPEYMGNPSVKVWVDLQTGLYYCPGSSLYAATPKGKYTSQSDAQQDAFEPAARKPCD